MRCCFCHSERLRLVDGSARHPFAPWHGPFQFYACNDCGSGLTLPPPEPAQLKKLYDSFRDGMPQFHREAMADSPQTGFYAGTLRRIVAHSGLAPNATFRWIEFGAGAGELSLAFAERFPNSTGEAWDLHECPAALRNHPRVRWRRVSLDDAPPATPAAHLIFAGAVWEHVREPDRFARALLGLLARPGMLYLMCPDYGSVARRAMGKRWHYWSPGEHLNMPTPRGAELCLRREAQLCEADGKNISVASRPVALSYTLRYALRRFGLGGAAKLLPASWSLPLPAGALEAVVKITGRS